MIDTYEKFAIPDEKNGKEIIIEVNWEDNPQTDQCKVLKLTLPKEKVVYVKKEFLNAMLFAVGNSEEQRKMIPQRVRHNRHYETVVSVQAKTDIRKGEKITFPIKISLPTYEEEVLGQGRPDGVRRLKEVKSASGLII